MAWAGGKTWLPLAGYQSTDTIIIMPQMHQLQFIYHEIKYIYIYIVAYRKRWIDKIWPFQINDTNVHSNTVHKP